MAGLKNTCFGFVHNTCKIYKWNCMPFSAYKYSIALLVFALTGCNSATISNKNLSDAPSFSGPALETRIGTDDIASNSSLIDTHAAPNNVQSALLLSQKNTRQDGVANSENQSDKAADSLILNSITKSKGEKVAVVQPVNIAPPIRYLIKFEEQKVPSWPTKKLSREEVLYLEEQDLYRTATGVPVFQQQNGLIQISTTSKGMRWVKDIYVSMTPMKCQSGRIIRTGARNAGAVSAGVSEGGAVCQ